MTAAASSSPRQEVREQQHRPGVRGWEGLDTRQAGVKGWQDDAEG